MDELIECLEKTYSVTWHGKGREGRRGGGVSVVVDNNFGSTRVLDITDEDARVETIWVAITPYQDSTKTIIAIAFYSSSSSEFKPPAGALQTHILDGLEIVEKLYKNYFIICAGDLNLDKLTDLASLPNIKQLVNKPTRKNKNLDKLYSDLESRGCDIHPPLAPPTTDTGKPSDHNIAHVNLLLPGPTTRRKRTIQRRKYSQQKADEFLERMQSTD